jgi:NAD(P)-dependent dehydrogenase (short-subunit alcohol dehydrogenase family)
MYKEILDVRKDGKRRLCVVNRRAGEAPFGLARDGLDSTGCFRDLIPWEELMRVLIVGATGTIGRAVVAALAARHEVVQASRSRAAFKVDLTQPDSIKALLDAVGTVDAIVCAAGEARFAPLARLANDDFQFSLASKLMGQVTLVRLGLDRVRDKGSVTVTSGILARSPSPGSAAISLVNAGLEGFVRAAALEAPRGIRVNAVSPPWVTETLKALGRDLSPGRPAAEVAKLYVKSVEGDETGRTLELGAR